jgi:hypothetical protein
VERGGTPLDDLALLIGVIGDRVTLLPASAVAPLTAHPKDVRRLHRRDLAWGAGSVALPGALAAKYPHAAREWGWQWVFPATRLYRDASTGQRRRHHLHESAVQRAVHQGCFGPGSPSTRPATASGMRLPRTCWRPGLTSVPCRNCAGTPTCARR